MFTKNGVHAEIVATFFLTLVFCTGCELLGDNEKTETITAGVYVANQGNFSDGNGTVTVYNPQLDKVEPDAFSNLGSIIQSLFMTNDRLYILANTGERIDVFDTATNDRFAQITDLVSPRYMVLTDISKAYVTNLFGASGSYTGGKVSVIDLLTNTKLKEIDVGNNPEGITFANGLIFVANHGFGSGSTVSIIDTDTNEVVNTIDVECDGPRLLITDEDNEIFVFCTGQTLYDENYNVIGETKGAVRILDGNTGTVINRMPIDGRISTVGPGQDVFYDGVHQEAYVVIDNITVLRFDTETNVLTDRIGPFEGDPIGAVGYDSVDDRLYLGRVPGFTERGTVTIHDRDGTEVDSFLAGVAPTFISFRRETK